MLTSSQVRDLRHSFRESKGHSHLPPASLLADKHSTAMFTIAGMQQLIPYLSGQAHPLGKRLHDIQVCMRTNDIEEVGDNSHHTMFFMMGNWSLGDYFKQDAVTRSREFLTQYLKLDPRKLAVTAYEGDESVPQDSETSSLRSSQGVPSDKISFLTAKDNFRSPGPVGPCGPCTEIYYRIGETDYPTEADNVAVDDSKWLEIWNNVFMEFYRDESGTLTKLDSQNVDTGMGFERICKVLQQKLSPYETDLFAPIIEVIEKLSNKTYGYFTSNTLTGQSEKDAKHMRVIADHMRCATFLMAEGLVPSNEGRGYVLRRIVRRMYYHMHELLDGKASLETILAACQEIIAVIIERYAARCPQLSGKHESVMHALSNEIRQFHKTLQQGHKTLTKMLEKSSGGILSGADAFMLYDTFGFPPDLTREIVHKAGYTIDEAGCEAEMEKAKERSRANTLANQKDIDRSVHVAGMPKTEFVGYKHLEERSMQLLKKIEFSDTDVLIFDKTPLYATMGGQIHDTGTWTDDDGISHHISNVLNYNGIFLHFVRK